MSTEARTKKMQRVVSSRQRDITIVIEDIYDPHNAEAIFRTCDAFGIQKAHLIFDQMPLFNPRKVGKATSSSANKWLDFEIYTKQQSTNNGQPTRDCLQKLKKEGYVIIATALTEKAVNLYQFTWPEKVALLVGNEHSGLSKEALELSDFHVQIPMQGVVQSLNVSVSTAIFLSELFRSRMGKDYSLSQKDQKKLVEDFLKR